jgi:hypothetical protein
VAPLSATATEASGCIGRASNVSGLSARSNLVYEVLVLCELTQLEVTSENIAVLVSEFVAKSLHGVCIDKGTGCFTFSMNCIGDFTSVFATFVANRINVAVSFAATLLSRETIFCDAFTGHIEAIFHATIDCIEAISKTIGDATELPVYILVVKALEQVGESERSEEQTYELQLHYSKSYAVFSLQKKRAHV